MKKRLLTGMSLLLTLLMPMLVNGQILASMNRPAQTRQTELPADAPDRANRTTLKTALSLLEKRHNVSFIYRSNLVDTRVIAVVPGPRLEQDIQRLTDANQLTFERVRDNFYIVLQKGERDPRTMRQLKRMGVADPNAPLMPLVSSQTASSRLGEGLEARIGRVGLLLNENQQDRPVRGRVSDENGAGLPGASVSVRGTNRGTTTDANGDYTISVPTANAVLVVSFIGYVSREASVGNQAVLNVTLASDVKTLQEVQVNIGYGTVARRDAVGALAVAGRKEFGDVNVQNISQLLQGKISGVQVINDDGLPGSNTRIVVRGTGSFTNADPLYVIDNIQTGSGEFNALNPNDIENITVLKDASSIAIYGAKGANGVVLVTTKRAKTGAPRVSYNGYVGVAQAWKKLDLLDAPQYIDLVKDIAAVNNTTLPAKLLTPDVLVNRTDWQDAIFRSGARQEHYININGGTDRVTYQAGLGYTNQDAILIGRNFQRTNLRFALEERLGRNNRVRLGQSVNVRYQVQAGNPPSFIDALRMPPYAPTEDPANLGGYSKVTTINDLNDAYNPLTGVYLNESRYRDIQTYAQVFGELDIIQGLTFRTQASVTFAANGGYSYTQANQNGNLTNANGIDETYGYFLAPLLENTLTFTRDFGKHNISVLAGNTYKNGVLYRNVKLRGSEFPNDDIRNVLVAPKSSLNGGSAGQDAFLSYFGRVQYQFNNRYLLTASIRRDRSPAFPNNPDAYFPAVGVAWKLHEEGFMKELPAVSELKLRASWGKAGNDNIGYFRTTTNIWKGDANNIVYSLGPDKGYIQGSTVNQAVNPDIRWEETTQTDVGLDLGLWNNKVAITLDYYNRANNGLLTNVYIPPSAGYGGLYGATGIIPTNAGSAFNRGLEMAVNYQASLRDLQFSVGLNAAYNKNEVTSIGVGEGIPITGGAFQGVSNVTRTAPGQPIGSFYGFVVDRVARDKAEVAGFGIDKDGNSTYQDKLLPGDIIFKDLTGDKKVDDKDQTYLGSPIPSWTFGGNLNAAYKGFDLMVSLQGVAGVQLFNALKYWTEGTTRPFNSSSVLLNRWRKEGDVTDIPRAGQNTNGNLNLRPSTRYVESGAYTRVRNVTVGYRLPVALLNKVTSNTLSNVRIYATAQNLFTFTGYTGYDPEVSATNNQFLFERGIDFGQYPQPRTFLFGLQVGF
jgi:TonB-dependent starch-binding outer membrane protein SusC